MTSERPGAGKRAARNAAYHRLAEAHPDDFHKFMAEEYEARGLTYERPLTDEEKAKETIRGILAVFPDLRSQL